MSMPNLNKVFAKKNVDDMTDAEKKEYYKRQQNEKSKKDQEEYEKKVSNLLECCKKFNHYLNYTYNDSDRWHLKFKEIFKEYLESKKLFSRTRSVLKDIYKNFQYYTAKKYLFVRGKYKGIEPCLSPSEEFEKLKFKPKKPDKYGYIKRPQSTTKT